MSGQVAIVTGASRGIGRGVAVGLGEAGWTVYVTAAQFATATAIALVRSQSPLNR